MAGDGWLVYKDGENCDKKGKKVGDKNEKRAIWNEVVSELLVRALPQIRQRLLNGLRIAGELMTDKD